MLNFFHCSCRETSLITLSPLLALFLPLFSLQDMTFLHKSQFHAPIWIITLELYYVTYISLCLSKCICILKYMTLVSCNLVQVTLKVVWVEIPALCFCVKYHTARLPESHRGTPDQAAGHLLTPPLEKTNSLTMKHLSPPPFSTFLLLPAVSVSFFTPSLTIPSPTFIHCFVRWSFPVFLYSALSHKAVSPLMFFAYCVAPQCAALRWQTMCEKQHNTRPFNLWQPFVFHLFSGLLCWSLLQYRQLTSICLTTVVPSEESCIYIKSGVNSHCGCCIKHVKLWITVNVYYFWHASTVHYT